MNTPGEQWSRHEMVETRGTKWWTLEHQGHLWNHVETKGCPQRQDRKRFQRFLHLHLRHKLTDMYPKCEDKECMQKHSGSELSGLKSAELLDAQHARLSVRGSHTHTRECKTFQDAWEDSRRTASPEEANCCGSRCTTTGLEFEFNGSRAEEDENDHCGRR